MEYIIDLLFIVLIILLVLSGKRKGFTRTLLSFIARVASFIAALFVSKNYSETIYETFLKENLIEGLENRLSSMTADDILGQISDIDNNILGPFSTLCENLGIDMNYLENNIQGIDFSGNIVGAIEDGIVQPIMVAVCSAVIFVIVSLVASFVLSFVVNAICKVVKLPVLRTADGLLGAGLGLINGVICAFVISYLLVIVSPFLKIPELNDLIASSRVIELFTNSGLII